MSSQLSLLAALHLAVTGAMFGLIWFVQVVHYPLFAAVGPERFVRYETSHQRLTSRVVAPLMAVEALAAAGLVVLAADPAVRALAYVGVGLLVVVHASTIALQVPCHRRLSGGFDPDVARTLVRTNWIRTVGWTARTAVAVAVAVAVVV